MINAKTSLESAKIMAYAKGKSCTVRIPHICRSDKGTEIMSHPPSGASLGKGWAEKPPDHLTAICCYECHEVIDGRKKLKAADYLGDYNTMVEVCFWRGHGETMIMLVNDGLILIE